MDYESLIPLAVITMVAIIITINSVIGKKNQVDFASAAIAAQLQKRHELIPNLVAACEKYMGYEEKLLKDLTEMRSNFLQTEGDEKLNAANQMSNQLHTLFALAESYPELKAIDTFTLLQRSLNEIEEQLVAARRAFNASVTAYNNACQMFPTSIAALLLGYKCRGWFEAQAESKVSLKVWG